MGAAAPPEGMAAADAGGWTWLLRAPTATELLLAALCWLGCYWLLRGRRRALPGLPPGPAPWPLVGNFAFALLPPPLLRRWAVEVRGGGRGSPAFSPHVFLTGLTKMYGSVFRLFVGSRPFIVLNTFGAVREALVQKAEVFSDRPSVPIVLMITRKKGKGGLPTGPGPPRLPGGWRAAGPAWAAGAGGARRGCRAGATGGLVAAAPKWMSSVPWMAGWAVCLFLRQRCVSLALLVAEKGDSQHPRRVCHGPHRRRRDAASLSLRLR